MTKKRDKFVNVGILGCGPIAQAGHFESVTKAHNDVIRVYESKLTEFGIPVEELGFRPLVTSTGTGMLAAMSATWIESEWFGAWILTCTGPAGMVVA